MNESNYAWGVRTMPSLKPRKVFRTRAAAEDWMDGPHAHESNVLVRRSDDGWADVQVDEAES